MPLYSIGHSNHEPEKFFGLIESHGIEKLIDIRRVPYSGRFPHFNRDNLFESCEERGIEYVWMGESLGGAKGTDRDIGEIESSGQFIESIKNIARVYSADDSETACLLCAERNPKECHRATLVGRALRALELKPIDLQHILHDGTLISQSDLELRGDVRGVDRSGTLNLFD